VLTRHPKNRQTKSQTDTAENNTTLATLYCAGGKNLQYWAMVAVRCEML